MSLLTMDFESVVSTIVEAMLPRGSGQHKVLVMAFDVRVVRRGNYATRPHQRIAHLMFQRIQNYTKVGWSVTDTVGARFDRLTSWEIKSDHDSCWRNDGVYSPMAQLVYEMAEAAGLNRADADVTIRFDLGQDPKIIELKDVAYYPVSRLMLVEYQDESIEKAG